MRAIVVGGGPAGMMAAIGAARAGSGVTLYEKNEKLGKKLYITGKGRCNVTTTDIDEAFFAQVARNPRFLYSSVGRFGPAELTAFLESCGVALKVERGGRVFPASDKASDITRALEHEMRRMGVAVHLNTPVRDILIREGRCIGVALGMADETALAEHVIVATGGLSYPSTGSTGDGLAWAERLGLRIEPPRASLVGMHVSDHWVHGLSGLTLKNVVLSARSGKQRFRELGELLLTHTGISGPLALSLSARCDLPLDECAVDLKPGLTPEQLDARLLRDIQGSRKQVSALMAGLVPARLGDALLGLLGWRADLELHQVTKAMRRDLAALLQSVPLHVESLGSLQEAVITRGGVAVGEINPATMAVKRIPGLHYAGEALDVDAVTGGYNLQIAFSTGYAAGCAITEQ